MEGTDLEDSSLASMVHSFAASIISMIFLPALNACCIRMSAIASNAGSACQEKVKRFAGVDTNQLWLL